MPQLRKLIVLILVLVTGLSACGTLEVSLEPPPTPSVDAAQVATIVAGTLAAWPSTPPGGAQTYSDPELGFRLQYAAAWQLDVKAGSGMASNGGRGRTISISKENYIFQLNVIAGPGDASGCAGMFQQNPSGEYQIYRVDGVELWRIKAEAGYINGFSSEDASYLNVISPVVLYKQADSSGFWGSYTCEPQIGGVGVQISYRLPVSLAALKAGHFRQDLLDEMDGMLKSITWK